MDLDSLRVQFHGRKFGELVLEHHKKLDLPTTLKALKGIADELPTRARPLIESWIEDMNPQSKAFIQKAIGIGFVRRVLGR
jgi:hypothetical protein